MEQTRRFGPQSDNTYHFRRSAVSNDLYGKILAVGGTLVAPESGVPYFKIPHATQTQRAAVDELVAQWNAEVRERLPLVVSGERVPYVGAALRRLGGQELLDPAGVSLGYVFRDAAAPLAGTAPAAARFALAKHVAGIERDPALALAAGFQTMTDRNAFFVRDEIRREHGTYYDRDAKATVFVPDATLDPATARTAYEAAQALVLEARERAPKEFDRLKLGLQIAIDAGLAPEMFGGERVNSLDDLVALDYGRAQYQDALDAGRRAYRALVAEDRERAVVIGGTPAYTLDAAIVAALGEEREARGLELVTNVEREGNRDRSRATGAVAYRASEPVLRLAERFASSVRSVDGRPTDAERLAQQLERALETAGADSVALYEIARNTASYGPLIARRGDRLAQLVTSETPEGVRAEIVLHDRRSLIDRKIVVPDGGSVSIGHLLTSDKTIDDAIARRQSVALATHGGLTFALSAGRLTADTTQLAHQDTVERLFTAAVARELAHLSAADYRELTARAERAAGIVPVPPVPALAAEASNVERAAHERATARHDEIVTANSSVRAEARALEARLIADATTIADALVRETTERAPVSVCARGPASNAPILGEIVGVFAEGNALLVSELVERRDERGFVEKRDGKPVLETPARPRLTLLDAREHVVPLANPYALTAGTYRDGTARDAAPLTIGVSRGALVTTKLIGPNPQRLVDLGYEYHRARGAQRRATTGESDGARTPSPMLDLGLSGKIASFDSDREERILMIETNLRRQIADAAGLNLAAAHSTLLRTHPQASIKDAAVALGITVERVEMLTERANTAGTPEPPAETSIELDGGDELRWKDLERRLARAGDRDGQGLAFDDFYGQGRAFSLVRAGAQRPITGTVVALDDVANVMYVHAHERDRLGGADKHRLLRVDYPARAVPVAGAAHLDGAPRLAAVDLGKTVTISYDAIAVTRLAPKIEVHDREIARVAERERRAALGDAAHTERSRDEALRAAAIEKKQQLLRAIADAAIARSPYAHAALSLLPTDDRARNSGFLYPIKVESYAVVVQVAPRGPGGGAAGAGFRVFADDDLYQRVAAVSGNGTQPNIGMYADILMDGQTPRITAAMTREEYVRQEADRVAIEAEKALERQRTATHDAVPIAGGIRTGR